MRNTLSPVNLNMHNLQAKTLSSIFENASLRKQALVDFTGCVFAMEELQNNKLRVTSTKSIFKCPALYKDFGIVDIYCNSHMLYVITTFDEKFFKIPTLHKRYDILPEAYVVVLMSHDLKNAEIQGVIYPEEDIVNLRQENEFFKINSSNLKEVSTLYERVKKYKGINKTIGKHVEAMSLFLPYIEGKLDFEQKKKLIKHILTCETCKRRLMEAVEFDTKSRRIEKYPNILSKESFESLGSFRNSLKSTLENRISLTGAIDSIYDKELCDIREENFNFTGIPDKAKKLIVFSFGGFLLLLALSVFAFNLPKQKTLQPPMVASMQGQDQPQQNSLTSEDTGTYELKVPKIGAAQPLTTVSKVSWEVPTGFAKDAGRKFLQSAGKNIRLNLQNDLLLSGEAVNHDRIKFNLNFSKDGSLETMTVAESSGSGSVDEIIKAGIKNTLTYMRPPKGAFTSKNGLSLIVEF